MPSISSLQQFFVQFDVYEQRVLGQWEYQIIFPGLDPSIFTVIHEKNQASVSLAKDEIQLSFLVQEIELSNKMPNLFRQKLPTQSLYQDKQVSQNIESTLVQLSMNKDVQFNSVQAFDYLFRTAQVDHQSIQSGLNSQSITVRSDSDALELVNYFKTDQQSSTFNKIHFVQGIKPWVTKQRPFQQNQQPTFNNQSSLNSNMQQTFPQQQMPGQQPPLQNQLPGVNQPWKDYNSDCTKAASQPNLQAPSGFKPHDAEYEIEEIIKGCFNGESTVYDHFERFAQNGALTKQNFSASINSLGCSWPTARNDEIFSKFDFAMNGRTLDKLSTNDLDIYIHFSCKKTVQNLHDDILIMIEQRQLRNSNLLEQFQKMCKQSLTCTYKDFKDVMNIVGVQLAESDAKFVTRKYVQNSEYINYSQFYQDCQNSFKLQKPVQVQQSDQLDYPKIVSEAIKKKLHLLQSKDLSSYLIQQFKDRPLSQQDFIDTFGKRLELVPKVCTDRILSEQFLAIDIQFKGIVSSIYVVRYFDQKSNRSVVQIKNDLVKSLKDKNCAQLFERHPDYIKSRKLLHRDFLQTLKTQGNLGLTDLDAEFMTMFYKHGDYVDVGSFLSECNLQQQSIPQTQPIGQKTMTAEQKKVFEGFQKVIRNSKLESALALNFKKESIGISGFIQFKSLMKSINDTITLKHTSKLSEKQVQELAGLLDKDQYGDFNYNQLLVLLVGERDAGLLINQAASQPAAQEVTKGPKTPKKILSEQELRDCQNIITEVRNDVKARNIQPEQFIESVRGNVTDKTISPAAFKKALEQAITPALKEKLTNQVISNLIHYLVREEPARVSFNKLYQALALPDKESPLKQEGVEEVLQYQKQLSKQLVHTKIPLSIIELNHFLKRTETSLHQFLGVDAGRLTGDMTLSEFEQALQASGYVPKEKSELIISIQDQSTGVNRVSLTTLAKHVRSLQPQVVADPSKTQAKYGSMDQGIRNKIQQISDYLIRNEITIEQFHKTLDTNGDNQVDYSEFVDGVSRVVVSGSITRSDLEAIFKAIDINKDHFLSVNEFGLFLTGAKLKREQRISKMDQSVLNEVNKEIETLFQFFDKGTGFCTAVEIHKTMQSMSPITMEQAQEMVKKVDTDDDGKISKDEFQLLMQPLLLDEYVSPEQDMEDLRAIFKDADLDHSGFLSIDEFYQCLMKMGADINREEIVSLFTEFDINGDMQIDIDEFVTIMAVGDQINFIEQANMSTYLKIKKTRKLDKLDFLKVFNKMPASFIPSFYHERQSKSRKNLPSSVFKVQIDPKTLLWKDMMPVVPEQLTPDQASRPENRPRLRPVPSSFGSQITIESAEGVPLPEGAEDRDNIMKRVIRVGLYDSMKQDLVYNSTHVIATWTPKQQDIWTFNKTDAASLNPLLFRTTQQDDLNKQSVQLIFELVVYMKTGKGIKEMSCGWAQTSLATCDKDVVKVKLPISGGSPLAQIAIGKEDIYSKRSGVKGFIKLFNKDIKSTLIVSFKPLSALEPETRLHLDLLPSTCLLQKKLLYLLSGYRNYAAEKLIAQTQVGILKKPAGDVVMSTFPKVYDCPDILEILAQVWQEDHLAQMTDTKKRQIGLWMKKMEEVMTRLYPVLYSVNFAYSAQNATESLCGDPKQLALRHQILRSALRHGSQLTKVKVAAPETHTTFKPFNVKELQFEVWDDSESKMDQIIKHYDQIGLISQENQKPNSQQAPAANNSAIPIPIPQVR